MFIPFPFLSFFSFLFFCYILFNIVFCLPSILFLPWCQYIHVSASQNQTDVNTLPVLYDTTPLRQSNKDYIMERCVNQNGCLVVCPFSTPSKTVAEEVAYIVVLVRNPTL